MFCNSLYYKELFIRVLRPDSNSDGIINIKSFLWPFIRVYINKHMFSKF